jgi:uncharacterized protein
MSQSIGRELETKLTLLKNVILPLDRVMVAFSGGVDSTLVLKVAYDVLGKNVLGVTAASPSLPKAELQQTIDLARHIGVPHRLVETNELQNPEYAANPINRCYFCKSELYTSLTPLASREGYRYILDGTNADDMADFRPGQQAAREHQVRSPLKEASLTKEEIHTLARHLKLPNWDKPASACLSSRIPHGTAVTAEVLNRIEKAEAILRGLGFRQLRVRHHGEVARIEVPLEEFPRLLEHRETVLQGLKEAGYFFVALDLAGFKSGSLNLLHFKN